MADIPRLASLIKSHNTIDEKTATLIGHTAQPGNIADYIAAALFNIMLEDSSKRHGYDGRFTRSPLAGQTVDIQWRLKHDGQLTMKVDLFPNYYLVFTGPPSSSLSIASPWLIQSAYLFHTDSLLQALRERGVQIGSSTSITGPLWERAEIYPIPRNSDLILTEGDRKLLILFA